MENNKKQEKTDDAGGGVVYKGMADPGTPTTSRKWAIWKETTTGSDIVKQYPVGAAGCVTANEQFAWDERLTLAYSDTDDTTAPTLSTVTIASNNSTTTLAKVGDIVTLTIVGSEFLKNVVATINGHAATVTEGIDDLHYTAAYTMVSGDTEGLITFSIGFTDIGDRAGTNVTAVTGGSGVTFDKTLPTASSAARTDNTHLVVTLSEVVKNAGINKANAGGWTVQDLLTPATTYAVSAVASGVDDAHVVLTVATVAASQANGLKVIYTAGGNGTIADLASNAMATNLGSDIAAW